MRCLHGDGEHHGGQAGLEAAEGFQPSHGESAESGEIERQGAGRTCMLESEDMYVLETGYRGILVC